MGFCEKVIWTSNTVIENRNIPIHTLGRGVRERGRVDVNVLLQPRVGLGVGILFAFQVECSAFEMKFSPFKLQTHLV